jgi:hypothetical protein
VSYAILVELSHYKPKKWDKKWDKGAEKCENGAKMQVFLSKMPVFEGALHPVNPCVVSSSLTGAAKKKTNLVLVFFAVLVHFGERYFSSENGTFLWVVYKP